MGYKFKKRHILYAFLFFAIAYYMITRVDFAKHNMNPEQVQVSSTAQKPAYAVYSYDIPLDKTSPWPKFRCNSIQTGRSDVIPVKADLKPWTFHTGKGIFSSPVIDSDGTVYIGSGDHYLYAIDKAGILKWKYLTGEIIDSSALLDDKGRIYLGSGDAFVYALNRKDGKLLWKFKAHTPQEVTEKFGVKTYNLNWFEGNIAMLADGSILAPNDNYLIYRINRDTGEIITQYLINEMGWSLPAVNIKTDRLITGSNFLAMKNVYCFDTKTGKELWTNGGFGTNAASVMLTSNDPSGAALVGGFDGIVRAFSQKDGKQIWKFNTRDHIYSSSSQLKDGTIIQACTDGSVYAINHQNGKLKWAFDSLEPIRSSPAIDGSDKIYFGSGDGRLYCLNPDGTLRWAYQLVTDDRNDMNGSPGLGSHGIYIAGQSGDIFFMPYDYPLTDEGRKDTRTIIRKGEDLPENGAFLLYTTGFGSLKIKAPQEIRANEPLAFTLFVRKNGDTLKSMIDKKALKVSITGGEKGKTDTSANSQFVTIMPQEMWTGPEGGTLKVNIKGDYKIDLSRFGLKFFGGTKGGTFEETYTIKVLARSGGANPYKVPVKTGDPSSMIELSRMAPSTPSMLPSYNQIGYDSLHYILGAVEGDGKNVVLWGIGGKLTGEDKTVINPELQVRFPLMMNYDKGLLTFYNYDGMLLDMNGSWAMPLALFRVATIVSPDNGAGVARAEMNAIAECDKIKFYGNFMKLMGMSDFSTGLMNIYGGMNYGLFGTRITQGVSGTGDVSFITGNKSVTAEVKVGALKKNEHVFGLLLVSEETNRPVPAKYIYDTKVEADAGGIVTGVTLMLEGIKFKGKARAYYMVDTYPAAKGIVEIK
jgi:outer membrane protein assembly factor BamB